MKINTLLISLLLVVQTGCADLERLGGFPRGYESFDDYKYSQQFANATPEITRKLKFFKVTDRKQLDETVAEMKKIKYYKDNDNYAAVFDFLTDRAEAAKNGSDLLAERDARLEKERIAREKAEEEERQRRAEFAKKYPFTAIIRCEIQDTTFPAEQCFFGRNNVNTNLELRNGSFYKLYQAYEIPQLDHYRGGDVRIPLEYNFELVVQNASENFILTLIVVTTENEKEIYRQSGALYKAMKISN
jgi:hypothetical protein